MSLPDLRYIPSPNYSSRGGEAVRLIVVHDCEGSFGGSVSWFQRAISKVSAHIVLSEDGTQAVQMVSWANKAWHACDFNPFSEGIEAAGFSAKGLGQPEWVALAKIVAFRLHAHGLPPTRAPGGNGVGFEQHVGLGAKGGGHHDITSNPAVWAAFEKLVQEAYLDPTLPGSWNVGNALPPITPAPNHWMPSHSIRHDLVEGSMEWVQAHLNALHMGPPLLVDGLDGPDTQAMVRQFQQQRGFRPDGMAGPDICAVLKMLT